MISRKSRIVILLAMITAFPASSATAIPYFARKYGFPCGMCHDAWVRNNDFGEAFRLRGFRLAQGEPEAGPSGIPAVLPVSFRLRSELPFESGRRTPLWEWELLAGGALGEKVSFFGHVNLQSQSDTSNQTRTTVSSVGFVQLSNLIPNHLLNLDLGFALEEPDLPAFRSHQWITRTKYLKDDFRLPYPATGFDQKDTDRPLRRGPGITFFGATSHLEYALGYKMGTQEGDNAQSDNLFFEVQRKIAGLNHSFERESNTSLALGLFAAAGRVPVRPTGMAQALDDYWRLGADLEVKREKSWSLAAGVLQGANLKPYGDRNPGSVHSTEWLVKGEYWLTSRLVLSERYEDETITLPAGINLGTTNRGRIVSNLQLYWVDNLRLSLEEVTFTRRWRDALGNAADHDRFIVYFDYAI